MIAWRVGPKIPKKLTNEIHLPSGEEWKHVRSESRAAGGGWRIQGRVTSEEKGCVTTARDRDRLQVRNPVKWCGED